MIEPFVRTLLAVAVSALAVTPAAAATKCGTDSVLVGDVCFDAYEASVWQVPDPAGKNATLVKRILRGRVRLADLHAAGAVQLGCNDGPFTLTVYPLPYDGNWTAVPGTNPPTPGIYAVSIAGVMPSTCITQLQARQACRWAGKHLVTNDEWQSAAAGTPDPGAADDGTTTCVTNSAGPALTGSRSACVSTWGAYDMIGNVGELIAEWADRTSPNCVDWMSLEGVTDGDESCFGGAGDTAAHLLPAAPTRGGGWGYSTRAGILSIFAGDVPLGRTHAVGFRCARH